MRAAWPWIAAVGLAVAGYLLGAWRRSGRDAGYAVPWRTVLLVVDPEVGAVPLPAVRVALRLVGRGGLLHVLTPVRVPLAMPLESPAGEDTERATVVLDQVERLAGEVGVSVRGHLRRGRTLRTMLTEVATLVRADAVVLPLRGEQPERSLELALLVAPAQAVLVPGEGGE